MVRQLFGLSAASSLPNLVYKVSSFPATYRSTYRFCRGARCAILFVEAKRQVVAKKHTSRRSIRFLCVQRCVRRLVKGVVIKRRLSRSFSALVVFRVREIPGLCSLRFCFSFRGIPAEFRIPVPITVATVRKVTTSLCLRRLHRFITNAIVTKSFLSHDFPVCPRVYVCSSSVSALVSGKCGASLLLVCR